MNLGPQMADISMDNKRANFNTGPYGEIGLRHVSIWSNLVLEPTFHDPRNFGGFGKR